MRHQARRIADQDPLKTNNAQAPSKSLGTPVTTADGSLTMIHPEHGETYHTQAGAMAEARLLYVESSGLAALWQEGPQCIAVLDVGLGLGLNAVATLTAWNEASNPGPLVIHSLEINRELVEALASGAAPWQEHWSPGITHFCAQLRLKAPHLYRAKIAHQSAAATATWQIHIHDAATTEVPPPPDASGYTHVWQDPFSPEKNPPLWQAAWFSRVLATASPRCVLMTYSVAGPVRRALAAAGWSWRKLPALLPGKREWLTATPGAAAT